MGAIKGGGKCENGIKISVTKAVPEGVGGKPLRGNADTHTQGHTLGKQRIRHCPTKGVMSLHHRD